MNANHSVVPASRLEISGEIQPWTMCGTVSASRPRSRAPPSDLSISHLRPESSHGGSHGRPHAILNHPSETSGHLPPSFSHPDGERLSQTLACDAARFSLGHLPGFLCLAICEDDTGVRSYGYVDLPAARIRDDGINQAIPAPARIEARARFKAKREFGSASIRRGRIGRKRFDNLARYREVSPDFRPLPRRKLSPRFGAVLSGARRAFPDRSTTEDANGDSGDGNSRSQNQLVAGVHCGIIP